MEARRALIWSLYQLLRPIARMALRHGLSARDAAETVKQAFVDVAREEYGIRGRPTNKARVAALTGLTRAEVAKLADRGRPGLEAAGGRHPLQRIISNWTQHTPWCDDAGNPRPLPITDGEDSFVALVRTTGGDLPYQTVLRELSRMALIETDGEHVHLRTRGFVPASTDETDRIPFVGENASALLDTMNYNLQHGPRDARFERKLVFPGLDAEGLKRLDELARERGQAMLELANEELTPHELEPATPRRMTGIGIYVFDVTQS